jgi:hypothetical protein
MTSSPAPRRTPESDGDAEVGDREQAKGGGAGSGTSGALDRETGHDAEVRQGSGEHPCPGSAAAEQPEAEREIADRDQPRVVFVQACGEAKRCGTDEEAGADGQRSNSDCPASLPRSLGVHRSTALPISLTCACGGP